MKGVVRLTRTWTIRPLCFGILVDFERSLFTYGRNFGQKMNAPCIGWLLQSGSETILVDTGPPDGEFASRWHSKTVRSSEHWPDVVLRNIGVEPSTVRLIILTHLHWDHCYNLEQFSGATFVVQADELRAAVDPIPTQRSAYEVGIQGVRPPWTAVFDRLELVRGDVELVPGVRVVLLPGHSPGLQGVLVETARGRHLIASDAVPLYENLGEGDRPPVIPGIHWDVAASLESLERARTLADVVLPCHDPRVLECEMYPADRVAKSS